MNTKLIILGIVLLATTCMRRETDQTKSVAGMVALKHLNGEGIEMFKAVSDLFSKDFVIKKNGVPVSTVEWLQCSKPDISDPTLREEKEKRCLDAVDYFYIYIDKQLARLTCIDLSYNLGKKYYENMAKQGTDVQGEDFQLLKKDFEQLCLTENEISEGVDFEQKFIELWGVEAEELSDIVNVLVNGVLGKSELKLASQDRLAEFLYQMLKKNPSSESLSVFLKAFDLLTEGEIRQLSADKISEVIAVQKKYVLKHFTSRYFDESKSSINPFVNEVQFAVDMASAREMLAKFKIGIDNLRSGSDESMEIPNSGLNEKVSLWLILIGADIDLTDLEQAQDEEDVASYDEEEGDNFEVELVEEEAASESTERANLIDASTSADSVYYYKMGFYSHPTNKNLSSKEVHKKVTAERQKIRTELQCGLVRKYGESVDCDGLYGPKTVRSVLEIKKELGFVKPSGNLISEKELKIFNVGVVNLAVQQDSKVLPSKTLDKTRYNSKQSTAFLYKNYSGNLSSMEQGKTGAFGAKRTGCVKKSRSTGRCLTTFYRKHAGCDVYATSGTPVYAIADGKINQSYDFNFDGTFAREVDFPSLDVYVRYGEISYKGVPATNGSTVKAGDLIGYVSARKSGNKRTMVHFEVFSGSSNGPLTVRDNSHAPAYRRKDLTDCTSLIKNLFFKHVTRQ